MALLAGLGLHGVMGTGYPLVDAILADPRALGAPLLGLLVLGKLLATLALVGGRIGPGLFSPILVIGAAFGALYGLGVDAWLGSEHASSFALVAMGALAAALLRAPLSMVLILFELSGNYTVVPTMLLASAVAIAAASGLQPASLYHGLLGRRGVDLDPDVPPELRALTVGALMGTQPVTVGRDPTPEAVAEAFRHTRDNLVWVVDADGRYLGGVHIQDALDAMGSPSTGPLGQALPVLRPDQPASVAVELLSSLEVDEAPVVDELGRLVGVLHERVLLGALRHPGEQDGG